MIELCLLNDNLGTSQTSSLKLNSEVLYICGKGKSKRYIAADVHTSVLFLIPISLGQPESELACLGVELIVGT